MKVRITALALLTGQLLYAQPDLSGEYGYSSKPATDSLISKDESGRTVRLMLFKMEDTKYRFWLNINKGWPAYHSGETDGTITFQNDTASFDNTYEFAKKDCIIHFRIKGSTIIINCTSYSADCGFGEGVTADDEYPRLKKQPVLDNNWLYNIYPNANQVTIEEGKAELYADENCIQGKKQYFVKGDRLLSIAETEKTFYTEYISLNGKFVFGWIKKTTVQR